MCQVQDEQSEECNEIDDNEAARSSAEVGESERELAHARHCLQVSVYRLRMTGYTRRPGSSL
jgi:hypothetical protein